MIWLLGYLLTLNPKPSNDEDAKLHAAGCLVAQMYKLPAEEAWFRVSGFGFRV